MLPSCMQLVMLFPSYAAIIMSVIVVSYNLYVELLCKLVSSGVLFGIQRQ